MHVSDSGTAEANLRLATEQEVELAREATIFQDRPSCARRQAAACAKEKFGERTGFGYGYK